MGSERLQPWALSVTAVPKRTRVGMLDAMRRHWLIVLATVVTLVGAGIGLGARAQARSTRRKGVCRSKSPPRYPSAVPGHQASSGLASIYSRAIYAPPR